ncbi:MAG: helix-turn-helix domain-containing protein, partial [Nocardioides sp.]|nr:helix-turn-helix domain-containing protein [Nocardioides sp.]
MPETGAYHGLICSSCGRLPDPTLSAMYLPAGYVESDWNGPRDNRHFDLCESAATHCVDGLARGSRARLPRNSRQYNITEAAQQLGITTYGLRIWILDSEDSLPATRMKFSGGSRFMVTGQALDATQATARHDQLLVSHPRPPETDPTGLVTLRQISHAIGVSEHHLRRRVRDGYLTPVERRNLGAGGFPSLLFKPDVLELDSAEAPNTALPAEWVHRHQAHLITVGSAAKRAGTTGVRVRDAMNTGAVSCVRTDGGTRLAEPAEIDEWAQRVADLGRLMSSKEAAEYLGISPDKLRVVTDSGDIACSKTRGGHRRFKLTALNDWKE